MAGLPGVSNDIIVMGKTFEFNLKNLEELF